LDNFCRRRPLPSIEEAWNLPISAEMNSRQQQQQQTGGLPGGQMSLQQPLVQQRQSFQKYGQQLPQNGPPPPYPQQQQQQQQQQAANKRFKAEDGQQRPAAFITQQELQMLQQLQQNLTSLNQSQHSLLQQLQHRYRLHQQQLRQRPRPAGQQQQQPQRTEGPAAAVAQFRNGAPFQQPAQQHFPNYASTASRSDSFQQQPPVQQQQFSPAQPQQSAALPTIGREEHVSEQDLQAILSQKDLTASLAEDLLKQLSPGDDLSGFVQPTNGATPPPQQDVKPTEAQLAAALKQEHPVVVQHATSSSSPHLQTPPARVKTPEIQASVVL